MGWIKEYILGYKKDVSLGMVYLSQENSTCSIDVLTT